MDEELRRLRKQAAAGDPNAAVRYFYALQRQQVREERRESIPPVVMELNKPRLHGAVELHPINLYQIAMNCPSEPNDSGGYSVQPLLINNVIYHLQTRYHWYPELGWVPVDPDVVNHARAHLDRYLEDYEKRGHSEPNRDLNWYIPRVTMENDEECFLCSKPGMGTSLRVRRQYTGDRASQSALTRLHAALREACERMAHEHRPLMERAHLSHINYEMIRLDKKIQEQRAGLMQLESQLGDLVIEEIRLQGD